MLSLATEKAEVLIEALPYIQKFAGKTVIIKFGGHAMVNKELEKMVLQDIILMKLVGMNPVIVHGGGPSINTWLKKVGIESNFVNGLRVTDEETMEIVEMVLCGKLNKSLVSSINEMGGKAIGLCGKDGSLIEAEPKKALVKSKNGVEEEVDLGLVGEITKVNPSLIHTLTNEGYIPVISPVGIGSKGESLNINADHAAGALGGSLGAHKLVLLTDVEGIYLGEDKDSLASKLSAQEVNKCIERGVINGGMIPKVESCLKALQWGVKHVHIIDGRRPHSVLLEIFTDEGIGTMVVK
ncbi:N-acetylglutamate kinase [Desulfonispora thiosulfatigenes DSM 11270]|uniref:Acetylglutamate kinase n=1 Tax=Desulfonispora thiosulfatigenes DSM 11270 TaxID=656914 RepID=A0A1W1VBP5_DESTI|nr:acetylglutamate kinase [Desulfonispora thiosulfatigenes]SMB90745.1 N-acetylglutamate kinase [Desulfonispora thiosulfatigenes DSM 11270]